MGDANDSTDQDAADLEFRVGQFRLNPDGLMYKGKDVEVWQATDSAGTPVAIKFFASEPRFNRTCLVLNSIGPSDRIIRKLDMGVDNKRESWLAMELASGNMETQIQDVPAQNFDRVRSLLVDGARGLRALHSHRPSILHMDLRPCHFLVSDTFPMFKLTGFSSAHIQDKPLRNSKPLDVSIYQYTAPEIHSVEKSTEGPWSDLYSLGMCAVELALGARLFRSEFPSVYTLSQLSHQRRRASWINWHIDSGRQLRDVAYHLPAFPKDLEKAIRLLTRKRVSERCQSAAQLLGVLGAE